MTTESQIIGMMQSNRKIQVKAEQLKIGDRFLHHGYEWVVQETYFDDGTIFNPKDPKYKGLRAQCEHYFTYDKMPVVQLPYEAV